MLPMECSKCGAEMPPVPPMKGVLSQAKFEATGFRCNKCGHWNDFTRRKWYKEQKKNNSKSVSPR